MNSAQQQGALQVQILRQATGTAIQFLAPGVVSVTASTVR